MYPGQSPEVSEGAVMPNLCQAHHSPITAEETRQHRAEGNSRLDSPRTLILKWFDFSLPHTPSLLESVSGDVASVEVKIRAIM